MKATNKIIAPLTGAVLLVILVVIASFWAFHQTTVAAEARKHSYDIIIHENALLSELKDAETGERGYLLTGDESFLQPYLAVRNSIGAHLDELRKLASGSDADRHLDALAPQVEAKMAEMSQVIELRRHHKLTAAVALVSSGRGKALMDAIRADASAIIRAENGELAQREAEFQSNMSRLFTIIIGASLLSLLLVLAFGYLVYLESRHRRKDLLHLDTKQLLETQEKLNRELQQANITLQVSEAKTNVTLNSIGDAVIVTDADGHVKLLNPLAEKLTGWTQAEASDHPVDEIFHIISQETRLPSAIPVKEVLAKGTIKGLANHTVLISRDGSECAIADSCAPIRDGSGQVAGAVLVFRDVTGEYAAQQALRDSAALIQTILNTVVDGVITIQASGGMIETVNPAAERMFGYAAADIIGKNFSTLVPELDRDQRNGSLDYYSASKEARAAGLGREVTGQRKDGSQFPLEIAVSEMKLGGKRYFTGILRDVSARKRTEEALKKAGALQNAIFHSINFSSIATDAKGVIQIFNVGAESMLGYSAAEVVNKITPADISDPQEVIVRAETLSAELSIAIAPGFDALVFKASRGIEDIYELTYIRKDGSRFPAIVSVTALRDEDGGIIGYLLIGTNNAARKRVEEERNQALALAEKANRAKTDFLSSMSHELRTPLNAVLGFAQLLEAGTPPPTPVQKRNIDQILKAGWYLLELINEILDLALIESGKVTLSHEPVALVEVMLECRAMIEPQAQKRGISLTFPRFEYPYFVNADRTRVKQVLINLLFNAIKYNKPEGAVIVESSVTTPGTIRISVRDTGAGLAPEQLAQLFQPFNRLGKEASGEEGTGIGLVVTKRLVELMGGTIGVDSVVGTGSVFWIELGLTSAPMLTALETELASRVRPQVPDGTPLRTLLYVEDNPANLELVEQLIARRSDLRFLSAADGNLGIEFARVYQPALILMDINLPGISGIDAMKILRKDPTTAHIPIIALSANAVPRDIERGLEAGFFNYLTKPIKVGEFMDALDAALEFAQTASASKTLKEEIA